MNNLRFTGALVAAATLCTSGAVRAADAPSVVNIGFTGPLSGGAAQYGADVQRGIDMAINEINAAGGITAGGKKYTFKLVSLDDQYRPNESAINAKRLVQESQTPIIICPHSGGILALEGFNEKQTPKFIVGAYSSEPAILRQNDNLVVMLPPRYDEYFKPFLTVEMKKFGKKLGLIPTSTAYGNAWKSGFSDAWKAAGGTVLGDNSVDYNTTADFSGVVSKALSEKPDVILVGGPSQPTALVIKAARDQGYNGGFVMMDQAKFDQVAKVIPLSRLDGTAGIAPTDRSAGSGLQPFLAAYDKAYGKEREPNLEVALNYMGMHAFARAMQLANSTSDLTAIMGKMSDAFKGLPKNELVLPVNGVSKVGHLELNIFAEIVEKGAYRNVPLTSIP
ncbi:MAG: ABC transporter substrate-binding protein [Candidatus Eremiobacteraeota bacterium]|nr:ABC transporter substrate-binding protein [Candidatus Eremiobacteraeota bacterium]